MSNGSTPPPLQQPPSSGPYISESVESRSFTIGAQATRELVFDVQNAQSEVDVQSLILTQTPAVYTTPLDALLLDSISAQPIGGGIWKCRAIYRQLNENQWTFDIGGGTWHATQSYRTMSSYTPDGSQAPQFNGAINVSHDRVEGADVPQPSAYLFSQTVAWYDADITTAYKITLANLCYCWNNAKFQGFAIGEVLLLGITGTKRGDDRWFLTYKFAMSPNVSNVFVGGTGEVDSDGNLVLDDTGKPIGSIGPISKIGWDYMWLRYEDQVDTNAYAMIKHATAAYVERVLLPGDFSKLNIGV